MNTAKVIFNITMSLDGFVAGPNDSPENGLGDSGNALFNWYFSGDTEIIQCINAGLMDEIHLDIAPLLIGKGVRLFDYLDIDPIDLEAIRVVAAPGVTHLGFRVVK